MMISIVLIALLIAKVTTQVCPGDTVFEKINNVVAPMSSSITLLVGSQQQPITKDCLLLCRQSPDCSAFNLNYSTQECTALTQQSIDLLPSKDNTVFQKMCVSSGTRCVDRPWAIERVLDGYMDVGPSDETRTASSIDQCASLCLQTSATCRSASFDEITQECVLHQNDRRSAPTAFHLDNGRTKDYLENQCNPAKVSNCHYERTANSSVITEDAVTAAATQHECERACDQQQDTLCRSYSFDFSSRLCVLSSDDVISQQSNITRKAGSVYGERKCIAAENCTQGPTAFERVTGRVPRGSSLENPQPADLTSSLTSTCLSQCQERGSSCSGIIVDYTNFLCQLVKSRVGGGESSFADFSLASGISYFEKICLTAIPPTCTSRAWTFDRVPGSRLDGFDDKTVGGILSRSECQNLCLQESTFFCRSAEYNTSNAECRLSKESRRTRPDAFKSDSESVDYLENQCAKNGDQCVFESKANSFPTYIDAIKSNVTSQEICQRECSGTAPFICRAIGYREISHDCLLSSVDQIAGINDAIQTRPETTYFTRKCETTFEEPNRPITGVTQRPPLGTVKPPWIPIRGRCDSGGTQVYEKTPGFSFDQSVFSTFSSAAPGFTRECRRRCDADSRCAAFTLNYVKLECHLHDVPASRQRLVRTPSSAYFELVCLKEGVGGCNRLWTFQRLLDTSLSGFTLETLLDISKTECQQACRAEKRFVCQSATFRISRGECQLSGENRFSQPNALVEASGNDYFENECAGSDLTFAPRESSNNCDSIRLRGKVLLIADKILTVTGETECQLICYQNTDFLCRSYSFMVQGECLLSSTIASSQFELSNSKDSVYVERKCFVRPLYQVPECTNPHFSLERTVGVLPLISDAQILRTNSVVRTSKECIQSCNRLRGKCMALVQRSGDRCIYLIGPISRNSLFPSRGDVYFEKICLQASGCGKLWTFDRIMGLDLDKQFTHRTRFNISSRQECQDLCLQEGAFPCRSAVYEYLKGECRLSSENRRSRPKAFRPAEDVDYLENQCSVQIHK